MLIFLSDIKSFEQIQMKAGVSGLFPPLNGKVYSQNILAQPEQQSKKK